MSYRGCVEIRTKGIAQEEGKQEDKESVMELCRYLLREATKELIEELREDEAHVLERFKDKEGTRRESERWHVYVRRFEGSKNATSYRFLCLQSLCAISSGRRLPKKEKNKASFGRAPPTLIRSAVNSGGDVSLRIHQFSSLVRIAAKSASLYLSGSLGFTMVIRISEPAENTGHWQRTL